MSRVGWAFHDHLRRRDEEFPGFQHGIRTPSELGLVSVILPVHNGERFVAEAIDSILAQTYRQLELIAVDDGSTDSTPEILARFARADPRVRVIGQENRKLPAALNAGLAAARGEFLTWTSDDNRMKPRFLEYMVKGLKKLAWAEMIYADYELIDEDGNPKRGSTFCAGLQSPAGSGRIRLPRDVSMLNYVNGNYIGPAFLYRDRARLLVGDYNPRHFTCEDYDLFLRVNEFLNLRHAPGEQSLYAYREHGSSLTARRADLKRDERTERLMRTDAFRRDMAFYPVGWFAAKGPSARELNLHAYRDALLDPETVRLDRLPREWFASIFVHSAENPAEATPPPLPAGCLRVLIDAGHAPLPETVGEEWDVCVTLQHPVALPRLGDGRRGWIAIQDIGVLIRGLRIRALGEMAARIETLIDTQQAAPDELAASVVICTCGRPESLGRALESVVKQTLAPGRFEVIVVNNDPAEDLGPLVEPFREKFANLRLVDYPLRGLSVARNAGLAEARGELVVYLDDDIVAEADLLERLLEAAADPSVGVVGGAIAVEPPPEKPGWWSEEAAAHWGSVSAEGRTEIAAGDWRRFPVGCNWAARRKALLEVGGFRCRYGRGGKAVDSGEEIVAALDIQRLGMKVLVEPAARVRHMIDPSRYTRRHLYRMMRDAYRTRLRLEQDLLIAERARAGDNLWHGAKRLARAATARNKGERVYHLFTGICCLRLGIRIVGMHLERLMRPRYR